ncbi:hypothetical protein OA492_03670 [Pelagibacteraceae bacterium]|nr:hypothetical protein [Pelagibacteraceae bacterium]
MYKYKILCYIVSYKHFLNIKYLFDTSKFNLTIIYERDLCLIDKKKIIDQNLIIIEYDNNISINNLIIKNNYDYVFLSTTQLRPLPIKLISESFKNKILSFSVQEVNQMFLHENRINNYLIDVNQLHVTSNFEKNEYLKLGYDASNIHVNGWPFQEIKKKSR